MFQAPKALKILIDILEILRAFGDLLHNDSTDWVFCVLFDIASPLPVGVTVRRVYGPEGSS